VLQLPHQVEPLGQHDQHHPDIVGNAEHHAPDILRVLRLALLQLLCVCPFQGERTEPQHILDHTGDAGPEQSFQPLVVDWCHRLQRVQERGDRCLPVQLHPQQRIRHREDLLEGQSIGTGFPAPIGLQHQPAGLPESVQFLLAAAVGKAGQPVVDVVPVQGVAGRNS
jgi:hypothetical protein